MIPALGQVAATTFSEKIAENRFRIYSRTGIFIFYIKIGALYLFMLGLVRVI